MMCWMKSSPSRQRSGITASWCRPRALSLQQRKHASGAVADVPALSRLKHGFESRRERQGKTHENRAFEPLLGLSGCCGKVTRKCTKRHQEAREVGEHWGKRSCSVPRLCICAASVMSGLAHDSLPSATLKNKMLRFEQSGQRCSHQLGRRCTDAGVALSRHALLLWSVVADDKSCHGIELPSIGRARR